jgi:hypothetical protein
VTRPLKIYQSGARDTVLVDHVHGQIQAGTRSAQRSFMGVASMNDTRTKVLSAEFHAYIRTAIQCLLVSDAIDSEQAAGST